MRNELKARDAYQGWFHIEHRTDKALRITQIDTGLVDWVPLSQVEQIDEQPDGTFVIIMTKWIARTKGFCDE